MSNDTASKIASLYPEIYHHLHTRWRKDEYRPSPEAIAVMSHLRFTGPLTVSEAAQHFDRAQSAMSELIDRLQTNNLVDRMPDARDRRRTLVWLTDFGLDMLDRCNRVLDAALLESCIKQMSQEDVMRLETGMEALLRAAESILNDVRRKT